MPQLDIATFPSQIFWIVMCFGLFYLAISRLVLPRIKASIDSRLKHIDGFLEKSDQLKKQAEDIMRESRVLLEDINIKKKARMEQAVASIREQIDAAKRRVEEDHAEKYAEILAQISKDVNEVSDQLPKEALVIADGFVKRHKTDISKERSLFCME